MEAAKDALLWLAVDPELRGVLIEAAPGTAKSLLARGFQGLLPRRVPFVEAPCGVTEDQLHGGLDLERTLATGKRQAMDGLLARAEGGFLYVDQVNLLICPLHIAAALENCALIGTYDPREAEVNAALAEGVAIHVREAESLNASERVEMLTRLEAFQRDPATFRARYSDEPLRERIAAARDLLPRADMAARDRRRLSEAALQLGVVSHRADIFAVQVARARAAFMGRRHVIDEDLIAAVRSVLEPRAIRIPEVAAPRPRAAEPRPQASGLDAEELVIPATDCALAEDLAVGGNARQPGRRKAGAAASPVWTRGRAVRAVRKRPGARKVALVPTLLAAAGQGRRRPRKDDLRFRQFRQKAAVLAIFVVDASGSMALSRMSEAKGAIVNLLQKAYLHRDRVALISFRGESAEVLLRPSRSVELAKRALDALPAGGGTPLAAGLHAALDLTRQTRDAEARRVLLVLLTDGRGNVETKPITLEAACAAVRAEGIRSMVIDNRDRSVAGGETERLARMLGGRHVYLPRPRTGSVCAAVAEMTEAMRI